MTASGGAARQPVAPTPAIDLLILGLGNVLCTDDGLGPTAIAHLDRNWEFPPGCAALDGGTLGLSLLGLIEDSRQVILIDAVELDQPPGTLVRLEGAALEPAVRERLSVHQVGVADLIDALALLGRQPETLLLLGAVPASIGLGLGLSPPLAAVLPALVDHIVAEATRLGAPPHPRDPALCPGAPHVRALFGL